MKNLNRNCPLCGSRLVYGPADYEMDMIYCEESVMLESGKHKNHYIEYVLNKEIVYYLLPYKITTTTMENRENFSKIGKAATYKSGKHYFKTVAKVAPLRSDTEENMRKRLKTIMVFS